MYVKVEPGLVTLAVNKLLVAAIVGFNKTGAAGTEPHKLTVSILIQEDRNSKATGTTKYFFMFFY